MRADKGGKPQTSLYKTTSFLGQKGKVGKKLFEGGEKRIGGCVRFERTTNPQGAEELMKEEETFTFTEPRGEKQRRKSHGRYCGMGLKGERNKKKVERESTLRCRGGSRKVK